MRTPAFNKYGFKIRTRVGVIVDNLLIQGRDEQDARRKLLQMYRDCEVIDCVFHAESGHASSANYEELLGLITR